MSAHLTTHILDAASGAPASGMGVALATLEGEQIDRGVTDADGRLALGPETLVPGDYAVVFNTGSYFEAKDVEAFYPVVTVTFTVSNSSHYHVPLLLSPFSYSTYRGS
ncbi:hydroxyisourate hydrolase [Kocuria coralli]|uniref:5-hydroxyisourate hydrolase n=1 Tax=Kocuria coralli TaxID=1461025 RepID=A0A5J5KVJ3_9MICC|nr:hydroxyisourate hydrolase [Kocuria coralli]KAA9393663.1 hydroxyisourate hydrolase [Kocuria coralli]